MIRLDLSPKPNFGETLFIAAGAESSASIHIQRDVKRQSAFSLEVLEFYPFIDPYFSHLDFSGAELRVKKKKTNKLGPTEKTCCMLSSVCLLVSLNRKRLSFLLL